MHRSGLIALAAAAAVASASPVRAQAPTVRMGGVPSDSYGEPYFGLDGGIFAKAGLNVDILSLGSGAQIAAAVAGGALDVGLADAIQIGAGYQRGLGFGYFAGGVLYASNAPTTQLCVAKNGPIKTPKDLAGTTLGVFGLRSMPMFSTREWLTANGVEAENVKFVEINPPAMAPAIARGTIAAGVVNEPQLSAAAADGVVPFAKVYDYCAKSFYISCFFAKRDWLAKNAEVAHKLMLAIYDTARWANGHHADTLAIVAKYTKMEPERIAAMTRATYDTTLDPKKLQAPIALATRYQVYERPLTAAELIVKV
jgi:NitT/TauT family transport system substrate-binding protein